MNSNKHNDICFISAISRLAFQDTGIGGQKTIYHYYLCIFIQMNQHISLKRQYCHQKYFPKSELFPKAMQNVKHRILFSE